MKRQDTDWEKIFVKHVSNKELIPGIHKELLKLNKKRKEKKMIKNQ